MPQTVLPSPASTDINSPAPINPIWELAGHIQIEKLNGTYNVRAFIIAHEPLSLVRQPSQENAPPMGIKTVILKQVRSVMPDKLTYFDHPALGMIILIKPYQPSIG